MRRLFILPLAVIAVLALAGISFAEIFNPELPGREGVKFGEIVVHSALTTAAKYESNVFLSDTDEKSDMITVINPSFGIEVPLRDNSISVEYDAFINEYSDHSSENHTDHKVNARAKIELTDYTIDITDLFNRFTTRRESETSVRLREQTNDARIGISAQFDQLGFEAGYTNKVQDYRSNTVIFGPLTYDDRDYMAHIIDLTASYRFLPKTSVLLETDLGAIDYDNSLSPNAEFVELLAGLRGEPHENLTVNLRAGVKHQEYDQSSLLNDENFTGFVARGGIDYDITEDDRLSVSVERGIYESVYLNMNYYTLNSIGLNYRHDFNRKLSGRLFGSYQFNDYPDESTVAGETKTRKDDYYSGGAGLTYNIREWLTSGLEYSYTQRDSNFGTYDYKDHVVMFRITIGV